MYKKRKLLLKKKISEYLESSEGKKESLKRIYTFQAMEYEQSLRLNVKSEAKWRRGFANKYYLTKFLLRYFKIFKI